MSNNINPNLLKNFIINTLGADKIHKNQANHYDIENDQFDVANKNEDNFLDVTEILEDKDLYAQFATLFVNEQEKKQEAKDKDAEKEEQLQIKDKNKAGV